MPERLPDGRYRLTYAEVRAIWAVEGIMLSEKPPTKEEKEAIIKMWDRVVVDTTSGKHPMKNPTKIFPVSSKPKKG